MCAGAHQAWFHLHGLLSTLQSEAAASSGSLAQGFAAAVEQFLQSATVGEFARRLDMVQTLRCPLPPPLPPLFLASSQFHRRKQRFEWQCVACTYL